MLAFAELYLGRIQAATEDFDITALIDELAEELGFRSGYLLSYATHSQAVLLVLDTNWARARWWEEYIGSGLRANTSALQELMLRGGVQRFDRTKFTDPRDPLLAMARKADMVNSSVVPIIIGSRLVGIVGLCGEQVVSSEQENTLVLLGYSLFVKAQSFCSTGIHVAPAKLTPRELDVIALSAEGLTSQDIADHLGMSPRTASQHMDNVAGKLGTKNRVHTVAEAIRRNLL